MVFPSLFCEQMAGSEHHEVKREKKKKHEHSENCSILAENVKTGPLLPLCLSIPTSKWFRIKMETKASPDLFDSTILTIKKI